MTILRKPFLYLMLASAAGAAMAQAVPPQIAAEQIMIESPGAAYVLGQHGNGVFRFAQTFQLPRAGVVSHIMLPIYCSTAQTVRVTIEPVARIGMPNGIALASQDVPGYALNSWTTANGQQSMRMVEFERPPLLQAGNYALTLQAFGGECMLWPGPAGDSYAGGQAFSMNGISTVMWSPWGRDLAFQVFERPR